MTGIVYTEITLKEFEWYLRDLFFRSNTNNNQKFIDSFKKEDIINTLLKKYLRYRNSEYAEISDLLNIVLTKLQKKKVIEFEEDNSTVKLHSKFVRKQCKKCFYINYLSTNENPQCFRCNSGELQEFPNRKREGNDNK
jgi:hypothetical protein